VVRIFLLIPENWSPTTSKANVDKASSLNKLTRTKVRQKEEIASACHLATAQGKPRNDPQTDGRCEERDDEATPSYPALAGMFPPSGQEPSPYKKPENPEMNPIDNW